MARNLSALRAMRPKNEDTENKMPISAYAVYKAQLGWYSVFFCSHRTSKRRYKGCATKPTPRSETARLKRNVLRGFDKEEVLLSAWIKKLLNMMAVMISKAFKVQLAM